MGDPIDVGRIRVGDTVRVVNSVGTSTFTVGHIADMGTGLLIVFDGIKGYGGRPGVEGYNTFFLVDRPSRKNARALTEVIKYATVNGTPVASDPLEHIVAPMLGLTRTKKGGRKSRRRKTRGNVRKSRT